MKVGQKVSVLAKKVMCKEDQTGTVISVYSNSAKVQLDNGTKWYIQLSAITIISDNM